MATAERAFLAELDGSCRTAMAAQLQNRDGAWHLRGEVLTPDGQTRWTATGQALMSASLDQLAQLGTALARDIRQQAGGDLPVFSD
jgi:hydroxymethylbilane synthase